MPLRLSRQRAHPGRQQVRVAGWPSVGPLCRVEWRVRRRIERSRDLPSIAPSLLDELAGARGLIVAVLHGFQVRAFAATDVVGSSSDAAYAEAGRRPVETAAPAEPRGYRCSDEQYVRWGRHGCRMLSRRLGTLVIPFG